MTRLSDDLLMDSYSKAIELKLCPKFINLLETEIRRRSLHPKNDIKHNDKESSSIN